MGFRRFITGLPWATMINMTIRNYRGLWGVGWGEVGVLSSDIRGPRRGGITRPYWALTSCHASRGLLRFLRGPFGAIAMKDSEGSCRGLSGRGHQMDPLEVISGIPYTLLPSPAAAFQLPLSFSWLL